MRTVRIKPSVLRLKDQSKHRKEYFFDGQAYCVTGIMEKSVPDIVATSWIAHDTDLEIWDPNER